MRDFRNVHESIQTGFEFDKCAVFLELYDFAFDDLTLGIVLVDDRPGLRRILLESQGNLPFLLVHGQNFDVDCLSDGKSFLRMPELTPGDFRNVEQSVQSADVYKSTVIGKAHHFAFDDVADVQRLPDFGNFLLFLFLQERFVREHRLVSALVDARYFDRQCLPDKFRRIFDVVIRQLRHGDEAGHFFVRRDDASLDFLDDRCAYDFPAVESCRNLFPVDAGLKLFLGEQNIAVSIVALDDLGLNLVAFLEQLRETAFVFEHHFALGQDSVLFAAEVNHDVVVRDLHHLARNHFASRG